jgi:hypothetical protein
MCRSELMSLRKLFKPLDCMTDDSILSQHFIIFVKPIIQSITAILFPGSPKDLNIFFRYPTTGERSRYSDGGIGVRVPVGSRIYFLHVVETGPGAHPSYRMGTGGSFPGVKRRGPEADHSPPTSVEVKKVGSILQLPHTPSWRSA